MDIQFTSNFGNFGYDIVAQVSEEQLVIFGGLGLGQVGQRTPCTDAEKEMVGSSWPRNKKGEPSRPKGFERSSIEFTPERAEILKSHLASLKNEAGATVEGVFVRVYEREEKVESKWAYEKGLIAAKVDPFGKPDFIRLGKLADKVGFEYEKDSELHAENVEFCRAIREHNKAVLAREMAD